MSEWLLQNLQQPLHIVQYLVKRKPVKQCFITRMQSYRLGTGLIQRKLRRFVSGNRSQIFLLSADYIEDLIERENVFTMEEIEKSVNAFLEFRQYRILKDNGRISHKQAMDKANAEYEIFNKTQPIESDFDKAVKKMIEEQK